MTTHFDGITRFWDAQDGRCIHEISSHPSRPTGAAISPIEPLVLIGNTDGQISRINMETFRPAGDPLRHGEGLVETVLFFSGGQMAATSSLLGGTIKIWDAGDFQELASLSGHRGCIQRISISPDGNLLAASGGAGTAARSPARSNGTVSIWDLAEGATTPVAQFVAHPDSTVAVAFSPDGTILATTGRDGKFHLWEVHQILEHTAVVDGTDLTKRP